MNTTCLDRSRNYSSTNPGNYEEKFETHFCRDDMETDPVGPAFPGHMMQPKMPGHLATPPPASASTPSSSSGGVAMNGGPVVGMQPPSSR